MVIYVDTLIWIGLPTINARSGLTTTVTDRISVNISHALGLSLTSMADHGGQLVAQALPEGSRGLEEDIVAFDNC